MEGQLKFQTTVLQTGKNTTGILVPEEIVSALGSGKRPAVSVTVNGYTYRSTIASMGGQFMISASAEVREKSGIAGGDDVEVTVELDTAPREVTLPDDFKAALAADPVAQAAFDKLSYSHKRRHTMSIEGAKTDETRQRRINKAVEMLRSDG